MCKKSEKVNTNAFTASPPFPKAPWVYVSAPWGDNAHVDKVKGMIDAFILEYTWKDDFYSNKITRVDNLLTKIDQYKDSRGVSKKALMIVDQLNNLDLESCRKIEVNTKIREHAAKCGRTFASANLHLIESTRKHEMEPWGPNHLDLNVAGLTEKQVADKVYKWLFTVIPPTEHIFLLTQAKLQVTDNKYYPDYEYCTLADIKNRSKDAKVQFGVVITSKPVVVPNTQRLHWTVADKTATGNFYFQYRGESSQYTWDWVQSLQPGDIKSLPRMACIQVRERRRVRVAKLPLRTASFAISTVGLALKGVGHGLVKVGDVMSMGKPSEFVPASDVDKKTGKKIHWGKVFEKEGAERKAKVEKARKEIVQKMAAKLARKEKALDNAPDVDSDSDTSTLRGSEKDVLSEKEFV